MARRYLEVPQHLDDPMRHFEEMAHMVAVGKVGYSPGELSDPISVAIDEISNQIYVTEAHPGRVSIFSECGKFLETFTHQYMKCPYGIVIHKNNVYVTDIGVHAVFHYKIEADMRLDAAFGGKGSEDGMFNHPRQLTVSSNGDVFIADSFNDRIQLLDESLYFKRSITHETMHHPVDVKLAINIVYVLSSTDSHCVHMFSQTGEKIRSIITHKMQVYRACFFCLDTHKNLIIGDGGAHCVKIFSPDGTLLHMMGGEFHGCSLFNFPLGLALTKQLKLVKIDPYETFQLKIFTS